MNATRWHTCNVLDPGLESHHLWQFTTRSGQVTLQHELASPTTSPLPPAAVAKTFRTLWQPRLNVGCLAPDQVFLRVVHLPKSSPEELPAMLELQLEKLSPLPLHQITWSYEDVTRPDAAEQTVILILAERNAVEQRLATFEQAGYLADHLDLPLLQYLAAHPPTQDGIWIYLAFQGVKTLALVGCWQHHRLQHISLLQTPNQSQGPSLLVDHLRRLLWGGQIEGWADPDPSWQLVADPTLVAPWESALRQGLGERLQSHPAPTAAEQAGLCARRATLPTPRPSLLPAEYASRYRQQFVDRLWMRGLSAAALLYLLGTLVYFGWARFAQWQLERVQHDVSALSSSYTNALALRARLQIYEEQAGLKFAALDCWRITSELLPTELILDSFAFQGDRELSLSGSVFTDDINRVNEFNSELLNAKVEGKLLFDARGRDVSPNRGNANADGTRRWDFRLPLAIATP